MPSCRPAALALVIILAVGGLGCSSSDSGGATKPTSAGGDPSTPSTAAPDGKAPSPSTGSGELKIGDETFAITDVSCEDHPEGFRMQGTFEDRNFGIVIMKDGFNGIEFGNSNRDDLPYFTSSFGEEITRDGDQVDVDGVTFSTVGVARRPPAQGSFHGSC